MINVNAGVADDETFEKLTEVHMDITGAELVQVTNNKHGDVLWVNVNGVCVLRICQIKHLQQEDQRTKQWTVPVVNVTD